MRTQLGFHLGRRPVERTEFGERDEARLVVPSSLPSPLRLSQFGGCEKERKARKCSHHGAQTFRYNRMLRPSEPRR